MSRYSEPILYAKDRQNFYPQRAPTARKWRPRHGFIDSRLRQFMRQAVIDSGLPHQIIARRAGVSQATVSNYIRNSLTGTPQTWSAILHACGIELSHHTDVLKWDDPAYITEAGMDVIGELMNEHTRFHTSSQTRCDKACGREAMRNAINAVLRGDVVLYERRRID